MPISLRHLRMAVLGRRDLERVLQLFQRRTREDRALIPQQVVRMDLIARKKFHTFEIARAEVQVLFGLADVLFHQKRRTLGVQLVQRLAELLALGFLQFEALYHNQPAIGQLRRQRRSQCAEQLLPRERIVIGAGLRSVHCAAMPPQRRANGSDARASGALLLPQFLARTTYQLAVLGGVGAGTLPGAVVLHRFPQHVLVYCAEYFISELEGADPPATEIHNINRSHSLFRIGSTRSHSISGTASRIRRPQNAAICSSSPPGASKPSTDPPCPRR